MSFNKIPLIGNNHSDETRNIINLMVQVINNRGTEILSDSAFLNWLHENGVKHLGEWSNEKEYDRQSVVIHEGNSYTSKKRVPVGIDIENEEFWVVTGNYNAQIEYYRQDVERVQENISFLLPNGVDDTENIREVLSQGKKLRLIKTNVPFKVNQAVVWSTDNFKYIDIEGQGGIVEIEMINTPSNTDERYNSMFRPNPNICEHFRIYNVKSVGNWDGVSERDTGDGYVQGIGLWLTPSENYIADVDNFIAERFNQYGIYFYVNSANVGRIYANKCRVQGTAIVNVRDWLNIDYISGHSNGNFNDSSIMGAGLDIELSTNRNMGMKNVKIGTGNFYNNTRGMVINSGNATDEYIQNNNIPLSDFNVEIDTLYTENNAQDGLMLDFPNVKIGSVYSKNNAKKQGLFAGVLLRNSKPLSKRNINIENIYSINDDIGFYSSSPSEKKYQYENFNISVLSVENSTGRGIYLGQNIAKNSKIGMVNDSQQSSSINDSYAAFTNIIEKGVLHGQENIKMIRETIKIDVPNNLSSQITQRLPDGSIVERIIVNVIEPGENPVLLRLRMSNDTKAQIDTSVPGIRIIGLSENILLGSDSEHNTIGSDLNKELRYEPASTYLQGDTSVVIYVEYSAIY